VGKNLALRKNPKGKKKEAHFGRNELKVPKGNWGKKEHYPRPSQNPPLKALS